MIKRTICLANSRKLGDRCVAGRELLEGGRVGPWIRPISARPDEAISLLEMRYGNGGDPRLRDIIDIPFLGPRSKPNQPENWLIDPRSSWRKVGECGYENLNYLTDPAGSLWVNGRSTNYNLNDYVLEEEANNSGSSLKLIAVDDLRLSVFTTGVGFENPKRRVQAIFSFNGEYYRLWATDSVIEDTYRPRTDGTYNVGSCYLTISLAEPFRGCCYKVVAGIIAGAR
jgi:hypothetical protein